MLVLKGRNVNDLFPKIVETFNNPELVFQESSRNGPVLVLDGPLTLHYTHPKECVLFDKTRDANPFLHFFDALYILSDRNDAAFLTNFSNQIGEYAESDGRLFGAYGHRMRKWFGYDQLQTCIDKLKTNPKDRQVVLGLWDPGEDLQVVSKDHPCNMMAVPRVQPDGRVSLTVYNRSNDMLWGAAGANAVQFSFLLQYIAMHLGREVGSYYQVANNPHVYTDFGPWKKISGSDKEEDPYHNGVVSCFPFGGDPENFDLDVLDFMANPEQDFFYRTDFFRDVVRPMWLSHVEYKLKNKLTSLKWAAMIEAPDWRVAVTEWLNRRKM